MLASDANPGTPYWWEGAKAPALAEVPPQKVDILVIGAGYTGLSAAIHAHDAGASVAVIDAGWPGHGASTRNGGMFGAHPRLDWGALAASYGEATADALFGEAKPALEFVTGLIAREKIDCDLQQTGRIQLAWTAAHFENQKRLAEVVEAKSDVKIRVVEKADLKSEIGTDCYFGGLVFPEHGAIQPRKLHEGLLCAVLERTIPVVPYCPAGMWQKTTKGFLVETPAGQVRSEKIILATNGYTPSAFPWFRRRVFPLPSYLIATQQLDADLIDRIAPGRRMMVETRARHSYFRISPDGTRLVWGGRAAMRNIDLRKAASRLRQTMCQVWPELHNVALSHVWSGNTGYSFGHMPSVGEHDGLHYALGYSGSGAVMAPYLGAKVGLRAAGAAGGDTAFADTRLRPSWLNPTGTPWFLYAADSWYRNWVDRKEWSQRVQASYPK